MTVDIKWKNINQANPRIYTPILFKCISGNFEPHELLIISGYRRDNYGDGTSRYVDSQGEDIGHYGTVPTHWEYLNKIIEDV